MASEKTGTSRQIAAKVAGLTFLLAFAIVVFAEFAIHERLIIPGDATQTAHNIQTHALLFRIGITGYILYGLGNVILLTALYRILSPVQSGLALLAAFFRLVYALLWFVIAIDCFDALRLIGNAAYLQTFTPDQLHSLARAQLARGFDVYYVGLLFYGLASTVCSWLWLKSCYVPRTLATFGLLASAWAAICALIFYVFPGFDQIVGLSWFDTPLCLFEIVLSIWLLIRGIQPSRQEETEAA